jgi:hypoxanthine-DNA glycosylase
MLIIESFPPIAAANCHTLILGSMPGVMSLAAHQYYAHPRNAFWPIVTEILAIDPNSDYATKTKKLAEMSIALWDVLKSCVREGSLDAAIEPASIIANDIPMFLNEHRTIRRIAFNGGTAAKLFRRHVQPLLDTDKNHIEYLALPSTSPAHASMRHAEKLRAWQAIKM